MKKSFFYIAGLALASFGVFAAFSDPANMTDDQKIEAKLQEKITAFNSQKDTECKATAMTEASSQFTMQKDAAIAAAAATPTKPGQKPKTPTKPTTTTGGSQVTPTPTPTQVTTTTTTTKPTDPNKDRGGATTTTTQKDRGGATTTTTQKDRGGATKTGN